MNQEDKLRDAVKEEISRISNLSFEPRQRKKQTEIRLEELRKELPEALTDDALGLTSKERVSTIKREIPEAEEFLQDHPLIDSGLEKRAARAGHELPHAQRQAERLPLRGIESPAP